VVSLWSHYILLLGRAFAANQVVMTTALSEWPGKPSVKTTWSVVWEKGAQGCGYW